MNSSAPNGCDPLTVVATRDAIDNEEHGRRDLAAQRGLGIWVGAVE